MRLSRDVRRPLYEIEGLISFYPHFKTDPPRKVAPRGLPRPLVLAARLRRADRRAPRPLRRGRGGRAARGVVPGALRRRSRDRRRRAAGLVRAGRGARGGRPLRRAAADPRHAARPDLPERSLRGGRPALPRAAPPAGRRADERRGPGRGQGLRPARHGRRRLPDRAQVGARGRARTPPRTTRSATPTSPSPAPSRTVRSWPSSPISSSRASCWACSSRAVRRGGSSSATSTGRRRQCCARSSRRSSPRACIGADVLGSGRRLRVEIFTSPGGYILGEESALLECMEGHRGEPRNKPPFPGVYGLWGKPTLMNSVETFAHVPIIVERGAEWWKEQGAGDATGAQVLRGLRPRRAARTCTACRWAPPHAS